MAGDFSGPDEHAQGPISRRLSFYHMESRKRWAHSCSCIFPVIYRREARCLRVSAMPPGRVTARRLPRFHRGKPAYRRREAPKWRTTKA